MLGTERERLLSTKSVLGSKFFVSAATKLLSWWHRVVEQIQWFMPSQRGSRPDRLPKLVFDVEDVSGFCERSDRNGLDFSSPHMADGYSNAKNLAEITSSDEPRVPQACLVLSISLLILALEDCRAVIGHLAQLFIVESASSIGSNSPVGDR